MKAYPNSYKHHVRNGVLKLQWHLRKLIGKRMAKWTTVILEDILIGGN